jgi:hypothetical protein
MPKTTLSELREIRDALERADALLAQRDKLILKAIEEGHSQRKVAIAAGLSKARVDQIAQGN